MLTRARILELFEALAGKLGEQEVRGEIYLVGGGGDVPGVQ